MVMQSEDRIKGKSRVTDSPICDNVRLL